MIAEDTKLPAAITGGERARAYGFLASVLSSAPTGHSIQVLCQLARALGIACPGEWSLAALAQEYMELFVVPNPRYTAPYESVYRDRWQIPINAGTSSCGEGPGVMVKGLLMGESTMAVRQCFVAAGVFPRNGLPDHIANELRLLAYLCEDEISDGTDKSRKRAELQRELCRNHLRQWISALRKKVAENDRMGFYAVALQITEELLPN